MLALVGKSSLEFDFQELKKTADRGGDHRYEVSGQFPGSRVWFVTVLDCGERTSAVHGL